MAQGVLRGARDRRSGCGLDAKTKRGDNVEIERKEGVTRIALGWDCGGRAECFSVGMSTNGWMDFG